MIVSFNDDEEKKFQIVSEWISAKLNSTPTLIKQKLTGFHIDPFTRTFTNENGQNIYLTAKEFDLLYLLVSHKGQVFTNEQLYANVWDDQHIYTSRNLTAFIRMLRKKD